MLTLSQNLGKDTDWIIHFYMLGHNNKCGISEGWVTPQIPSIVMINRPQETAIHIELRLCFETNFDRSAQRKENRYGSLLNDRVHRIHL